jgi:hypothetical protein
VILMNRGFWTSPGPWPTEQNDRSKRPRLSNLNTVFPEVAWRL